MINNEMIAILEDNELKSINGGNKSSSKRKRNNALACGAGIISGALTGAAGGLAGGTPWTVAAGAIIGGAVSAASC